MTTIRNVTTFATIRAEDAEFFGPNEIGSAHTEKKMTILRDNNLHDLASLELRFGGEIRIEVYVRGARSDDDAVSVTAETFLYEGTSEDTNDLDGRMSMKFEVPKDQKKVLSGTLRNHDEGGDYAVITIEVDNQQVPTSEPIVIP
jgi:hypothetical protein